MPIQSFLRRLGPMPAAPLLGVMFRHDRPVVAWPPTLLPFLPKLSEHLLRREVEVDLRRGQPIVAQEPLQGRQREAFLNGRHREGVTQHVGGHRPADVRPVGHGFDQALHRAGRHAEGVVEGKVPIEERLHTCRQRAQPALGARAIWSALTVDHEPVILPVEIVLPEIGQFGDPQAGIQQRPNDELFLMGPAGIRQASGLIRG